MAAFRSGSGTLPGWVRRSLKLAAGIALSAISFPAHGDPLREGWLFWDVHTWESAWCQHQIGGCYDTVAFTEEEGDLEFDLYAILNITDSIGHARFTLDFPATWRFMEYVSCLGGIVTVETTDSQATVDVFCSPPHVIGHGPIGRVRIQVAGRGTLSFDDAVIDGVPGLVHDGYAQAGVHDCFCYQSCGLYPACQVSMPDTIRFEVPQGRWAVDRREVYVPTYPCRCQLSFDEEESWMHVDVTLLEYYTQLTVTVYTAGLPIGEYTGSIDAHWGCTSSTTVLLYVTEDLPIVGATWGRIKATYH